MLLPETEAEYDSLDETVARECVKVADKRGRGVEQPSVVYIVFMMTRVEFLRRASSVSSEVARNDIYHS